MSILKYVMIALIISVCVLLVATEKTCAEPANTYVYVSNYYSNTVSVIDPITSQKVTDIITDSNPSDIIVNPAGTYLYVAYDGASYVDQYNLVDYSRVARIPLTASGAQLTRMTSNPEGTRLYISLYFDHLIYVIDTTTNTVLNSTDIGSGLMDIMYYNTDLYVSAVGGYLYRIDADTFELVYNYSHDAFSSPDDIAIYDYSSTAYDRVYVHNANNGSVVVINPNDNSITGILKTGMAGHGGIDVNSSGYVYMMVAPAGKLTIFNSTSPISNITIETTSVSVTMVPSLACSKYNTTVYYASNAKTYLSTLLENGYTIINSNTGHVPYRVTIGTQATPATALIQFRTTTAYYTLSVTDVNVSVYDTSNRLLYSDVTDDRGTVSFYMNPTIRYNILFNQSPNINVWYNVTPTESSYLIAIPFSDVIGLTKWSERVIDTDEAYDIRYTIDTSNFNSTTNEAWINLTYTDPSGLTATHGYFLYQNNSNFGETATLVNSSYVAAGTGAANFSISGAAGNSYNVVIMANQTSGAEYYYRTGLSKTYPGPKVLAGVFPLDWYFWMGWIPVFLIFCTGTVTKKGYLGVFGMAAGYIFTQWGWYSLYMPDIAAYLAIGFGFILSIVMIFVERERFS